MLRTSQLSNIFAREILNFAIPVFNFVALKNYYVMK